MIRMVRQQRKRRCCWSERRKIAKGLDSMEENKEKDGENGRKVGDG